jgi:prepilin-type N-terminal cleavage/methylation domain-containing protein
VSDPAMIPSRRRAPHRRSARWGFTLTEMMIALALLGVVGAAMVTVVINQQRFYRGATDVLRMRGGMRQAAGLLPIDLRGSSSVGGDIYDMNDHMIEFRANTGSSIVCFKASPTVIVMPPMSLAKGNSLTSWLNTPVIGDSVLIYDDGPDVGSVEDQWRAYEITGIGSGAGWCPTTSGFVQAADALQPSWAFQVSGVTPLTNTIIAGAPIRFFRKARYELYQAKDNNWYLGWYDCLKGRLPACSQMQPLSGPYRSYSAVAATSGLTLTYHDSLGVALDPAVAANRNRVARINLTLRGQATKALNMPGRPKGSAFYDSLSTIIGLRNRS